MPESTQPATAGRPSTPKPTAAKTPRKPAPPKPETAPQPKSFVSRIAEAMAAADAVTKASTNNDQGYKFASAEAILAAVRNELFAREVILTQSVTDQVDKAITSRNGANGMEITLSINFTFHDGLSDRTIVSEWKGVGQDYGDKALGKAFTNAVKTFVRGTWLLPTEHDDPEKEAAKAKPHLDAANAEALKAALASLSDVVGRDFAREVIAQVRRRQGDNDLTVGQVEAWLEVGNAFRILRENRRVQREEANAAPDADAVRDLERQEAATEPPPVPEVGTGSAAMSAGASATISAPPVPPAEEATPPPKLPAGSVVVGNIFERFESERGAFDGLRAAGCICPDPIKSSEGHATPIATCPIAGHGTPDLG